MSGTGWADLTWAQRVEQAHAREAADGFQYGVVWRQARSTDEQPMLGPPAGSGWVLNTHFGDAGQEVRVPRWSAGDVVQQLTHWRRSSAGMVPYSTGQTVHERVAWDGDPRP